MTTAKTKTKVWPPIHQIEYASGKVGWQVACQVKGKRLRETFPTKGEADKRADEIRAQIAAEGRAAFDCPIELRIEATNCAEILAPYDATLTEAVEWYAQHVLRYRQAPTVKSVITEIVNAKRANGRRERTVASFRSRCDRFAEKFGERRLSDVNAEEVRQWLHDETAHGGKLGAVSRVNYLVAIGNLFSFGVRRGYCDANPVKLVDRPSRESGEVKFLTVPQVVALLIHAKDAGLVPYVALGVFAGLRPEKELRALTWDKVNLPERTIRIDASMAKTRQRRVIEISDALAAYLTPYAKKQGQVVEYGLQEFLRRWKDCRSKAGLLPWAHDVMRHTFATYHLAAQNDIGKLSLQMGNSAQVVHAAYKGLVSKADAERFWSLRPADAANVIPMQQAANA